MHLSGLAYQAGMFGNIENLSQNGFKLSASKNALYPFISNHYGTF